MTFRELFKDPIFVAIPFSGGNVLHTKNIDNVMRLNTDAHKQGAYLTVNGFAKFEEGSQRGRTKENVTSLNASFLDIDLTPETRRTQAELIYKDLCDKNLQPTAVVLTGKGLHVYWFYKEPFEANERTMREYEGLQYAIVEHFRAQGADPQARDAARVLRIPGARYYNKAGEYTADVELLKFNPETKYEPKTIREFFKDSIRIDTEEGRAIASSVVGDFDVSTVFGVKIGHRHHAAYSAALSLIQRAKSLADARTLFNAAISTWESPASDPLDYADVWNQFEEAKRFLEKDRPQLFIGDKEGTLIATQSFESVEGKPIEWLWQGFIAKGKTHMLTGDPGLGKSQITLDIAARLSTGESFPNYLLTPDAKREPVGVIILSSEDDAADTIKPRLIAAGADLKKVIHMSSVLIEKDRDGNKKMRSLALREDAERILEAIAKIPFPIGMIIIDPISAFLSGTQDSNSNSDARGTLAQLQATILDKGIALLMINHNNKNTSAKSAHMRSMGSVGWNAAARATFYVFKDKDNEKRRIFSVGKMNLVEDSGKGFFYEVKSKAVQMNGIEVTAPFVEWDKENFPVKGADEYSIESNKGKKESKSDECEVELDMYVSSKVEGVPSKEGMQYMKERGFSQAEIYRAARKLGILNEYGLWKK